MADQQPSAPSKLNLVLLAAALACMALSLPIGSRAKAEPMTGCISPSGYVHLVFLDLAVAVILSLAATYVAVKTKQKPLYIFLSAFVTAFALLLIPASWGWYVFCIAG